MNEVAMMDKNLSIERTPQLIAIEINSIKEQTRKIMLFNSIEIGKRLAEAKIMLAHGEWGDWLKESVDYSQRTASNLMGIFEQYGTSQISMFCDNNAKSQALANLSYTQAVLLMGIPMDEREAFIEDHDVENMTTRELQQAIKEKQELEDKLREVEAGWINSKKAADDAKQLAAKKTEEAGELVDDIRKLRSQLTEAKDQSKNLKAQLSETQASGNDDEIERLNELLKVSLKRTGELEQQLKETPIDVTSAEIIEKVPEEIERELNELRERNKELEAKGAQPVSTATIRFKLQFDSLVKGFGDLLRVLTEIDAEENEKYKNVIKGLIGKMSEKL